MNKWTQEELKIKQKRNTYLNHSALLALCEGSRVMQKVFPCDDVIMSADVPVVGELEGQLDEGIGTRLLALGELSTEVIKMEEVEIQYV